MAKQKSMSRDDLLVYTGKVTHREIKALGGKTVCFRPLSAADATAYNTEVRELKKETPEITTQNALELSLKLLILTMSDSDGNLLFTEDDLGPLSNKPMDVVSELIGVTMEMIGVSPTAIKEAQDKLKNAQTA